MLIRSIGVVGEAARTVKEVSRLQSELLGGRSKRLIGIELLLRERQLDHRIIHAPSFGSGYLQDENVMGVVVYLESLGIGRGKIQICLERTIENLLRRAA